jgi:hypothetical protein
MDIPRIQKRISQFVLSEEGRVSRQALLTMGALMSGSAFVLAHPPFEAGCAGVPGNGGATGDKSTLAAPNAAYNPDGSQKFFGTKYCSDDATPFHFNGTDFSYTNSVLSAQHHHHGSHNSY